MKIKRTLLLGYNNNNNKGGKYTMNLSDIFEVMDKNYGLKDINYFTSFSNFKVVESNDPQVGPNALDICIYSEPSADYATIKHHDK